MKPFNYSLIVLALLLHSCTSNQSVGGFKLVHPDSSPVTGTETYNGYTNHWQNNFRSYFRFGNLFKFNIPDVNAASRAVMIDLATDLGLSGLQMQEGFVAGLLASDCRELTDPDMSQFKSASKSSDLLVFADPDSELGIKLSAAAPCFECIGDYQSKALDYTPVKAFVLKKGGRTVYAVLADSRNAGIFKAALDNVRNVLSKYDMKRGWFGVSTCQNSVTCDFGDQLDVIGRGVNEGNSWFVFSGPFEFLSQKNTHKWVDEIGNPVVVDHGYPPLFGSDYSELQVQMMSAPGAWAKFQNEHGGYMAGTLPSDTVLPEADCDFYYANSGARKSLNRVGRPFVVTTGDLVGGTCECMVLFTPKGEKFNREKMWDAILGCRAVAVLEGDMLTGPDEFRKALELLAIDRTFIEDYFSDKVSMLARVEGHKLVVDIDNFHSYIVGGEVSLSLPPQISAGAKASQSVKVPAHSCTRVVLDIDPSAEAMGRVNAVMAKFDWENGSKTAVASCSLPPAVSVHQLLFGTESECKFPVGIHNITHDPSVKVNLAVLDSNNGGTVVYTESKTVDVANGTYAGVEFNLKLPEGSYTVKTTAMGVVADTQLGIGAESGNVKLREVDLNGDGVNEYEMENSRVKVTLLTTGARIIEYKVKGVDDNVFFKLWPDQPCDVNRSNRDWGFWPFGGFEDFLGQASVETHKVYDAEITRNDGKCAEVTMTADYYGNIFNKTYTLYGDTPLVGVRYALDFVNPELSIMGPQPILVLGKSHGQEDKFYVPELDGVNTYVMDPVNMYGRMMSLKEGWNAGYDIRENVSYVGAYPVGRPNHLHMWMNLDTNGESHYPYAEFQPWVPIYTGNTTFFSYYMWADGCPWEQSLQELKDRNLITVKK